MDALLSETDAAVPVAEPDIVESSKRGVLRVGLAWLAPMMRLSDELTLRSPGAGEWPMEDRSSPET